MDLALLLDEEAQGFATARSRKRVDAASFAEWARTLEAMKKSGEVKAMLNQFGLRPVYRPAGDAPHRATQAQPRSRAPSPASAQATMTAMTPCL